MTGFYDLFLQHSTGFIAFFFLHFVFRPCLCQRVSVEKKFFLQSSSTTIYVYMTECPICTETQQIIPFEISASPLIVFCCPPQLLSSLSERSPTRPSHDGSKGNEQWIQKVTLLKIEAHVSLGNSGHWCFKDFYAVIRPHDHFFSWRSEIMRLQ